MRRAALPGDEPLEARSGQLAAALAARLPPPPGRRLCGPALRARQTADILGLNATVTAGVRDQDHGVWAGRNLSDIEAEHPASLQAWTSDTGFAPAGGESVEDLLVRAASFLHDMHMLRGGTVAVTHTALIRAIVLRVLDAPPRSFWLVDAPPLSVTEFTHDGRRWALRLGTDGG